MKQSTLIFAILMFFPLVGFAQVFPLSNGNLVEVNKNTGIWQKFTLPTGLLFFAEVAYAEEPTLMQQIEATINSWADNYGVSRQELSDTADCESGWRTDAEQAIVLRGDHGMSYGLFQYYKNNKTDTFKKFKTEAGFLELQRENWQDQTKLSAWAFSQGYKRAWTCWRKLFQ